MIQPPCYNCSRRHLHCHSSCPEYRTYTETLSRARAAEALDSRLNGIFHDTKKATEKRNKWVKAAPHWR